MENKSDLFPKLVEIEGVEEHIPGVVGTWDKQLEEDEEWKRSTEDLDWEVDV
jgi:hypothetical protein